MSRDKWEYARETSLPRPFIWKWIRQDPGKILRCESEKSLELFGIAAENWQKTGLLHRA